VADKTKRGRFITFEGGEGAGKSTQAAALAQRLKADGKRICLTREPGGSDFAERVRQFILDPSIPAHTPLSEALLFFAARADHLATLIRPSLDNGIWVVCDRFTDSTRTYQGAAGGLPADTVAALDSIVVGDTAPDLTLVLDLPVDIAFARVAQRRQQPDGKNLPPQPDPFESRNAHFHERLRQGFLEIAAAAPERCVVIDASGDRETIARAIWKAVETKLLSGKND